MNTHPLIVVLFVFTGSLLFATISAAPNTNIAKANVYKWLSLMDSKQEASTHVSFIHLLSASGKFHLDLPGAHVKDVKGLAKWFHSFHDQFQSYSHSVLDSTMSVSSEGSSVKVTVEVQVTEVPVADDLSLTGGVSSKFLYEFVFDEEDLKLKKLKRTPVNYENKVKRMIKLFDRPAYGGFITIPSHKVIENIALPKLLDFAWIEAEHTEFGPKEVQDLVVACENENIVPIVRVPENNPDLIKKYIGTGVRGVIIPAIKTKEEAQYAVSAVKYPPLGNRPAGCERANRYLGNFAEYKQIANDEVLAILMIETKEAVDNIEDILDVEGVDLIHMGPFDLSLSMGVEMTSSELAKAVAKVEAAANARNIPLGGAAGTLKNSRDRLARGYRFFTIPGDMELLQNGVRAWFN